MKGVTDMWYAFKNKRNGKFIHGTDFRYSPPRQRLTAPLRPSMFFTELQLETEIRRRHISLKQYEIVDVTELFKGNEKDEIHTV